MTDTPTTEDWLLAQENIKGYTLRAYRLPYFDNVILEFVQVDHPDGTSSYFRGTEPGPFGGGFSWATPKYVQAAATRFFNKIFVIQPEESESHEPDNNPNP